MQAFSTVSKYHSDIETLPVPQLRHLQNQLRIDMDKLDKVCMKNLQVMDTERKIVRNNLVLK